MGTIDSFEYCKTKSFILELISDYVELETAYSAHVTMIFLFDEGFSGSQGRLKVP